MNNGELIEYAIRTSNAIKEEIKPKLIDYFYKQKEVIDKINLIIKGIAYGGNEDYYMENFSKINELLKEVSE
jgi:hypothetical protein